MQHKSEHQVPSSSVLGFPFWEVPFEKYIDAIQNSKAQQVARLESSLRSQFQQSGLMRTHCIWFQLNQQIM